MAMEGGDQKRKGKDNKGAGRKRKRTIGSKLSPDFSIPVFQGKTQVSKEGQEGLEELLAIALDHITTWFTRQVNRQHYKWAEEKLGSLKEKLEPMVEPDQGLSVEVLAAFEAAKAELAEECATFAKQIVAKIAADEQTFTASEALESKEARAKGKEAKLLGGEDKLTFLKLQPEESLVQLLEEATKHTTTTLAIAYTDKCGVGFAKHYNRKMNHVLKEQPNLFQFDKKSKSWSLA